MKKTSKAPAAKSAGKKVINVKTVVTTTTKMPKAKKEKSTVPGFENLPADAVEFETPALVVDMLQTNDVSGGSVLTQVPEPEPKTAQEIFLAKEKKAALKNDNIFIDVKLENLSNLTGLKVRKGFSKVVVAEGEIVNVVSPNYFLLKNEDFFLEVEKKLMEADIKYISRSINRQNSDFAVDYILADENYHVDVKGGKDKIIPMLRFTNMYGGGPCTGKFGFFREVCANGLHVAETKVGFRIGHRINRSELIMPNIKELVGQFLSNEFYSLHKKFKVLAETPITDLSEFVKFTCTKMDLFKYEASEKNPDTPSAKAQLVMDTILAESKELGVEPNLWIGYNAFNVAVHSSNKKAFSKQMKTDGVLFNTVYEMAAN